MSGNGDGKGFGVTVMIFGALEMDLAVERKVPADTLALQRLRQ